MRNLIVVGLVFAMAASVVLAAEPDWYVKKDTNIDTYIASMNKIIEQEKDKGAAIPAYRNEESLPLTVFPKYMNSSDRGKFRLNVSGVKKLYPEMNPGPEMLDLMNERGIPVVIGSDSHVPWRVGDGFEAALGLLEEAGYAEVSLFRKRQRYQLAIVDVLDGLRSANAVPAGAAG